MKKIFLLLTFVLLSVVGFSQGFKTGGIFLRVTDSATYVNSAYVTAAHADNYADIWYSTVSDLFWKWNGSSYEQLGSGGGSFWPLTGTGTATGSIIIEGGGTPNELTIQNFDQIDLASNGGFGLTAQDLTVGVVDGMVFNASNGDMHFQTVNNKLTLEGDTLELENFVAGIRIDGNFGTAGQALTSNGPGAAPTWETPAGGGGGATAAGATGNVQYKSNGGGLQAEAAFSYDSATNILDVDNLTVDTEAYDATGWNADLSVPTKDAVRDKIETMATVIGAQDFPISSVAFWPTITNGCADLARTAISTAVIQTLDFDQTTQEFAQTQFVLPRNWNNGTVTATVYWTSTGGTGAVVWGISGAAYSNDDGLSGAFGTAITVTDTFITNDDVHVSPTSSAITLSGSPADADFLMIQISRNPADGSDTLTADAKLIAVRLTLTLDAAVSE